MRALSFLVIVRRRFSPLLMSQHLTGHVHTLFSSCSQTFPHQMSSSSQVDGCISKGHERTCPSSWSPSSWLTRLQKFIQIPKTSKNEGNESTLSWHAKAHLPLLNQFPHAWQFERPTGRGLLNHHLEVVPDPGQHKLFQHLAPKKLQNQTRKHHGFKAKASKSIWHLTSYDRILQVSLPTTFRMTQKFCQIRLASRTLKLVMFPQGLPKQRWCTDWHAPTNKEQGGPAATMAPGRSLGATEKGSKNKIWNVI